ncbi:MAG: glycosyltransferase family 4 protein [Candidatus Omnitrophica bacterium]|nr:glycosyltransferase family 4 protein [Candidatus Omnitrophota bacterium]MDD5027775.1 glycosyltransferase family 4 protein [Candidatus Omnitrophota bacterium]MDD5661598.1 glycosyltransferase family 4 protein [Candidatus Omnitrophota bacterium]
MDPGNKINLLYVVTKLELGGAQKQLLSLIRGVNKERFNLFLFTGLEGLLVEDALAIPQLKIQRCRFLKRPIQPGQDFLALINLYSFIKKNNIGIVHTHSSKAGFLGRLAAKLAGAKVIIHTVHGWSFHKYQPLLLRRLFILLERFAALFTDKLVVVSSFDRAQGLENRVGTQSKYSLIPYGIDYAEFDIQDSSVRRELGLNDRDLVVGMVACFKPQKCPQDFIKLAGLVNRYMPGVKFILVGDGILRKRIERLIAGSHLEKRVILTGWRRDIQRVLSALDVFVLTSLWEGLPVTVLEAMAAAKAVIATDTGGVREAVDNGKTGFLIQPHDVEGLAKKLVSLFRENELSIKIGRSAQEYLKYNFKANDMIDNTEALYASLTHQASG